MPRQSNYDYYSARVQTERALAAEAEDATIAALHNELANRYAELLAELEQPPERSTLQTVTN